MDRHVNLRDARVLVALTAGLLCVGLLAMLSCARQTGVSSGHGASVAAQPNEGSGEPMATDAAQSDTGPEPGQGASRPGAQAEEPAAAAEADSTQGSAKEQETQPMEEPAPLEPASLAPGDELSAQDVERAGGASAFFSVEPIPDAVFARMEEKSFGADCTVPRDDLRYLRVLHVDAEGRIMVGELVVHRNVADEVLDIFSQLYEAGYPIRKMRLVDDYDASDDASCADDNTSSFNYRVIAGTSELSNHAYGLAIDINPFENPYCRWSLGLISPDGSSRFADRSLSEPYMIHTDDFCYQLFVSHGWTWGGHWAGDVTDYQHFEKPDALWQ